MLRGALALVIPALVVSACATTSSDVKQASGQLTAALSAMDGAVLDFQALYLAEIQQTRTDLQDAYIARAVRLRTRALSSELDGPAWEAKLRARGLLAVAEEIEASENAARELVGRVATMTLAEGQTAEAALGDLYGGQAAALRTSAAALREKGLTAAADALDARAAQLEAARPDLLGDPLATGYLKALVELSTMARDLPLRLEDLRAAVDYLAATHGVVDGWIQADVKPSGEALGELFDKHGEQLNIKAPRLPRGL
ncbi:MAG: hypothetical protein R3F39_13905 [Myxococcota bacterium]